MSALPINPTDEQIDAWWTAQPFGTDGLQAEMTRLIRAAHQAGVDAERARAAALGAGIEGMPVLSTNPTTREIAEWKQEWIERSPAWPIDRALVDAGVAAERARAAAR
jgi:hypothetical protein